MDFLFILLYFLIIALVIEISVRLFVLTGIDTKVSRFQVISMLTGTGFTTDESKVIIDHPIRRNIGTFLILFGAFSLAVIISSISNLLASDLRILELSIISAILMIVLLVLRTANVKKRFENILEKEMENNYALHEHPIKEILYLDENDLVTDVVIKENSPHIGLKIEDIITFEQDILVLYLKRGEINIRKKASQEEIKAGDQIFLYGNQQEIEEIFHPELDEKEES
ncbi:hypothetical protein D0469_05755 [Peribacillus saganii]|uniref:RCK C-terminal domain-containing protein n=1 Tax=Peribacillus saganii TaxID=2303992 RepID=A0A372LQY6_9BACI|nr:TrkA C-terminal domain-containing protein [Peribacillus saganii]RFU70639.1 hypothetical protein D0469_05755 [Peribacillus saganii]